MGARNLLTEGFVNLMYRYDIEVGRGGRGDETP